MIPEAQISRWHGFLFRIHELHSTLVRLEERVNARTMEYYRNRTQAQATSDRRVDQRLQRLRELTENANILIRRSIELAGLRRNSPDLGSLLEEEQGQIQRLADNLQQQLTEYDRDYITYAIQNPNRMTFGDREIADFFITGNANGASWSQNHQQVRDLLETLAQIDSNSLSPEQLTTRLGNRHRIIRNIVVWAGWHTVNVNDRYRLFFNISAATEMNPSRITNIQVVDHYTHNDRSTPGTQNIEVVTEE